MIFLDCPPGISLLSEAIFEAADVLLTPIIPTTLSARTLHQLQHFIAESEIKHLNLLPFFTMVDRRKKMHKDQMQSLRTEYPGLLTATIPYASDIERMGIERKPLACFMKNSPSNLAYQALWQELTTQLKLSQS